MSERSEFIAGGAIIKDVVPRAHRVADCSPKDQNREFSMYRGWLRDLYRRLALLPKEGLVLVSDGAWDILTRPIGGNLELVVDPDQQYIGVQDVKDGEWGNRLIFWLESTEQGAVLDGVSLWNRQREDAGLGMADLIVEGLSGLNPHAPDYRELCLYPYSPSTGEGRPRYVKSFEDVYGERYTIMPYEFSRADLALTATMVR